MSDKPTPRSLLRNWKAWLTLACAGYLLFLILLPFGVKYSLAWWLAEKTGADISINDIDINLFTGELSLALMDSSGQQQEFDVGLSRIDFNWWPLTQKHLLLPELHFKDMVLDIRREEDGALQIGGLKIPAAEPSAQPAQEAPADWGIGFENVRMENVELRYVDPKLKVRLLIEQLELTDLYSWEPEQDADLEGSFVLNDGQFKVKLKLAPFAENLRIAGDLEVDSLPTGWALPLLETAGITKVESSISSKLKLDLQLPPKTAPLLDVDGELQIEQLDLVLTQPELAIRQKSLTWQGKLALAEEGRLDLAGDLQGSQLGVIDNRLEMSTLQLENYALDGLQLEQVETIRIADTKLTGVKLLQREAGEPDRHLVHLQQLLLTDFQLSDFNRLEIEKVALSGLDTVAVLNKEGALSGSQWWQQPEQQKQSEAPESTPATESPAPFQFRIGSIDVGEKSYLGFIDQGPEKPVELGLSNFLLNLGSLDSASPETASDLKLSGELDRYARLNVSGSVQPLLAEPGLQLEGELKGLSLPQLNPYIVEVLESRILNGQANATFTTRLKENQLQADIELVLAQLETAASRAFDSGSSKPPGSLTNMPLNLIKNSDGDVELDLEIEGDLSSPEFNTTSLIQQAMLTAIGKAMTASLAPLGIQLITGVALPPGSTLLASALFDMMTKINIPAVVFDPGETTLPSAAGEQINKLESLLKERPKLQLRLCGMATRSDLAAIQKREMALWKDPKTRKKTDTGKEPPARLTEPEAGYVAYQEDLLEITRQRADGIKGELVEKRGADPGRLYLCDPDIDVTPEGQPRVDIRL